jgi:uroporphyrinogen decarboxylase
MSAKRDRLKAAIAGEIADRPPVALWRHFPVDDQTPPGLVDAVLAFQTEFDFDLVKVTGASSYALRGWGVEDAWEGSTEGTRRYTKQPVTKPGDWGRLSVLEPSHGSLGDYLRALRLIVQAVGTHTPVLATVFSPLAQAKNLAGEKILFEHIRHHPDAVLDGLDRITRTTSAYVQAVVETGVDGVFYAVQFAALPWFDRAGYERFGLPFDRAILERASGLWLNMLHLHGNDVLFDVALELPGAVVNWHDQETPPGLAEGKARSGKAVCGGLSREAGLLLGTPDSILGEARRAFEATDGGAGLILGTGCVVPIHAPRGNLMAARRAVDSLAALRPSHP